MASCTDQGRILNALPAMTWVALPDGSIDFVNQRWSEYTGVSLGETGDWDWQAVVDPQDLDRFGEGWRSILASGRAGDLEARLRRFDGQYRWHTIHCNPLRDDTDGAVRWYGVATDIDQLRRGEEALRRRQLDFQSIVDSIPIPVAVTTPSGEVEGLNQLTLDYFGKTLEELKGWKASDVVHPDDLEHTVAAQIEAHKIGSRYSVESRHLRADGAYRWYNVHGLPLRDSQGQILRWLHLLLDIDDRKQAEEALRESERKAHAIVDGLPGFVAIITPEGKTDVVNRQMAEYHGLTPEELKKWCTNKTIHDDDLGRVAEIFHNAIASGTAYELEYRLRRFDGVYRWFYSRGVPLRDPSGQITCWYALQTDIDDRKKAEEALAASERSARLIVDSIPAGVGVLTPTGEVETVNKHILDYFGKTEQELKRWGAADVVHPDDLQRVVDTVAYSIRTGEPYDTEQRLRGVDGKYRWFQVQGLPLKDALGRIVRWYALHVDIDEKKRADEAVAASERNLQLIIDTMPAMAWSARPDGRNEFLSKQYVDYFGLSPEQIPGWNSSYALHPDDRDRMDAFWRDVVASGMPGEGEARLRRHDGAYRWFLFRANPLRDDKGNVIKWYGVSTDVDDMKRAEQALAASEREYRAILDSIPARVGIYDPSGRRISANRRAVELSGFPADTDWRELFHPDDVGRAEKLWQECLTTEQPFECEHRARMADGTYRWHSGRRVPLRDENGKVIRWYGVSYDIEDRKRAEQALQESERQSRLIVDSIPARVGVYDANGMRLYINKSAVEFGGEKLDWRHVYHPDDLGPAEKQWRLCLEREEPFELEYRARDADGAYRWRSTRRVPMRDATGKVIRWYGVSHDIEDRKRAEQALAESERNLQATIDSIPVRVGIYNADGANVYVNKRTLELSGQPSGVDFRRLFHPDDLPPVDSRWRECLATEEPFECEYRAIMADGTYRWHVGRRVPMRDETGKVIRWYGVTSDIEDLKQAEQALAASERNLQATIDTIPAMAWSASPDGAADFFNQHYLDYIGLAAEQARGWGWTVAVHPDDMIGLAGIWQAILAGGKPGETEARLRRHDGEYRWFLFRANPLRNEHGNIVKWYGVNTDIEDRKRSEEGFRAIVETTPECVKVVARDGTVLHTNGAGAVMAGAPSVDAVIGLRFFDFVAPEHREKYRVFHETICAGQKGFLEFDLVNAQGVRRHMETHAGPLRGRDGSIVQLGVTRDMTARKQMEDALRRSEAFLAEGQHLARMGNLSWHVPSGEIIWSEQLYRIFEFEPGTVVTIELITSRVHPEDLPLLTDMVERAQRGESDFEYQYRIVLRDQSIKHLHLIAHRARDHADQIEYIGAVLDVTQRRLSEEALEKLRSELAQVTRIMSLGALTASIAHEVNQPLAGIITNASTCLRMLAADPPNVDGARETARRTIRDGNRAADVIARLRSLFSKKAITVEPVDLNDAVREVIALSWGDLQRSRIVLRTELGDELPPVDGDRIQLQQVIMNLLRNATDAMSSVEDRPRKVLVRTWQQEDGRQCLAVKDSGVGFGPQGPEKLFDAFYSTKHDGMGIGLSVSRSIVEGHGGRLWAERNDGPGATFLFSIPENADQDMSGRDVGGVVGATNAAQHVGRL